MSSLEEFQEQRRPKFAISTMPILKVLNLICTLLIVVLIFVIVSTLSIPQKRKRAELEERILALENERNLLLQQTERLQRENDLLLTDPEYVDLISRDRLHLREPGEWIIHFSRPQESP